MYAMWHVPHHSPFLEVFREAVQPAQEVQVVPEVREVSMVHEVKQVRAVMQVH